MHTLCSPSTSDMIFAAQQADYIHIPHPISIQPCARILGDLVSIPYRCVLNVTTQAFKHTEISVCMYILTIP